MGWGVVYIIHFIMHQSIPAAPSPPSPRAHPWALAFFFTFDGKFPGVGTLELSNPPGWGRKKTANAPSYVNTATFFIDRTVESCHFKHFNVRFYVAINVFLCNSAILIRDCAIIIRRGGPPKTRGGGALS